MSNNAFKITHPNKFFYPEDKITKQDLFNYYEKISPVILPYIVNRPLTLLRCTDTYISCFYQRHPWRSKSSSIKSIKLRKDLNQPDEYLYLTDQQGLLDLIQFDVLEINPWSSTIDTLEAPDMIIFDLDPASDVSWSEVVAAAFDIKKQLERCKLICFVKTTGGKGLHIVLPIQPTYNWDEIKLFAHAFAGFMEKNNPCVYTSKMSKSKRCGKIFIDYLRNQRTASAISPYSSRARLHAPVATPLSWDELTNNVQDTFYTIKTLPSRLHALSRDPWEKFWFTKQELPSVQSFLLTDGE